MTPSTSACNGAWPRGWSCRREASVSRVLRPPTASWDRHPQFCPRLPGAGCHAAGRLARPAGKSLSRVTATAWPASVATRSLLRLTWHVVAHCFINNVLRPVLALIIMRRAEEGGGSPRLSPAVWPGRPVKLFRPVQESPAPVPRGPDLDAATI
jgi:hypothetical protein